VNFVAAHTGWPWVEELIALGWKHRNVYIATTAHAPRYWDPKLIAYINTRGRDRVLFGTDYPVLGHKECMDQVEELDLRTSRSSACSATTPPSSTASPDGGAPADSCP